MKYRVALNVTQRWVVVVDADSDEEAMREAKLAYDRESNPWEILESVGDEDVQVTSCREGSHA